MPFERVQYITKSDKLFNVRDNTILLSALRGYYTKFSVLLEITRSKSSGGTIDQAGQGPSLTGLFGYGTASDALLLVGRIRNFARIGVTVDCNQSQSLLGRDVVGMLQRTVYICAIINELN